MAAFGWFGNVLGLTEAEEANANANHLAGGGSREANHALPEARPISMGQSQQGYPAAPPAATYQGVAAGAAAAGAGGSSASTATAARPPAAAAARLEGAAPKKPAGGGAAAAASSQKVAPWDPEEPGKAATVVAAVAGERLRNSWKRCKKEFDTLNLVWQSNSVTVGQFKSKSAQSATAKRHEDLAQMVKETLAAAQQDALAAAKRIPRVLEASHAARDDGLNAGTETALKDVVQAQERYYLTEKLIAELKRMSADFIKTRREADVDRLEGLLKKLAFENVVEGKVRRAFHMQPTKADREAFVEAATERAKAARLAAMNAKVAQVAEVAKVPMQRAKEALDKAKGDSDLAAVALIAERNAAVAQAKAEAKPVQTAYKMRKPRESSMTFSSEAPQRRPPAAAAKKRASSRPGGAKGMRGSAPAVPQMARA
eukprot:TRINITY_DN75104_c0_g1_i1.p1 TRINITY_DN75104_c0_g1~~TRINITY_DN75104_c0_g1_i1.p1  ORF type:complete len:429 (+),score=142.88 TRINITY_DN75104_c0_g1_i1:76-1362(+)